MKPVPLDRTAATLLAIVLMSVWIGFGHPAPLSLYGKVMLVLSGGSAALWLLTLVWRSAIGVFIWGLVSYLVFCGVTLSNDRQIRREAKRREKQAEDCMVALHEKRIREDDKEQR